MMTSRNDHLLPRKHFLCSFFFFPSAPVAEPSLFMSMRVEAPIITMTFLRSSLVLTVAIVGSSSVVEGLHVTAPQHHVPVAPTSSRRDVLTNAAFIFAAGLTANQEAAHASTRGYHISRKLKAKEAELRETAPHQALPSGVAIQQFQSGRSGFGTFLF